MSSFGDENYKTSMEEWLSTIIENNFGKKVSELTDEEKLQVFIDIVDVAKYIIDMY